MATKTPSKQSVEPSAADVDGIRIASDIDLESAIADQLLDDIDWTRVKTAMLSSPRLLA